MEVVKQLKVKENRETWMIALYFALNVDGGVS